MLRSFTLLVLLLQTPLMIAHSTASPERARRVVFFGDSITELGEHPDGYLTQLRATLAKAGEGDQFEILGAGIGGNKVYDLYLRMDDDVLARVPDIVVVFVGVNDVWHKRTSGTGTDADKFVKFYEAIVKRLQEKKIRVILTTPACIGEKTDCSNDLDGELNHYAQMIRDIALQRSCTLVDLRKEFLRYDAAHNTDNAEKGILTVDGVHFSTAGNELAAGLFYRALVSP
jgi:lysophospholipase L1-like esterase